MLDQVLALFAIKPDFDLDIMRKGQSLDRLTADLVCAIGFVIEQVNPDMVLVHGDTATTFAGALSAYYRRVPVGHVEAGLRTGNKYSPWPEEMNRKLTGAISTYHFAPTESARLNLLAEGVGEKSILVTGNTVIDALLSMREAATEDAAARSLIQTLDPEKRLILVTGHRRESFGKGFEMLCQALLTLASRDDVEIVYPVHLNPNVREPVHRIIANVRNIHLLEPLEYLPFIALMERSHIILTDSGGIQEEAPSLGKPVLVTRETTERPEAVTAGTVKLVGTDPEAIITAVNVLLDNESAYKKMAKAHNPYGDGKAAQRIIAKLKGIEIESWPNDGGDAHEHHEAVIL
jgi:UDP-N-acetylglucosamine 2-epimerase (non-hydrolysing)